MIQAVVLVISTFLVFLSVFFTNGTVVVIHIHGCSEMKWKTKTFELGFGKRKIYNQFFLFAISIFVFILFFLFAYFLNCEVLASRKSPLNWIVSYYSYIICKLSLTFLCVSLIRTIYYMSGILLYIYLYLFIIFILYCIYYNIYI